MNGCNSTHSYSAKLNGALCKYRVLFGSVSAKRMTEDRLTGLALMHIHYNMDVDTEEIVKNFALQHPRRMEWWTCSQTERNLNESF